MANTDSSTQIGTSSNPKLKSNFTPLGMWAFSIGTSIGWGSFIVTCNTYLQKSGILGTVIGMLLGMAKYESGDCVASVFERADIAMYNDKADLKASIT